ncbi:Endoglucanase 5 [Acorus gramineus]|uniref:Endoglucanase n=1 Tax=Acorus gramineus TaxID=55184 RepID=A0AAV9ABL1_ACOGR|nr:Endoglucanase 5 [Acorus gramineus]
MKSFQLSFLTFFLFLLSLNLAEAGFDYGEALEKSLLFFEAQRSGKLPPDQRVEWRGNSGLRDGFAQGVNLVGGYYDSGDHVKFGFPMAYALTMLSWGAIEFEKEMAASNQLEHALSAIRWGTDYFIRAHKQPNLLWAQVLETVFINDTKVGDGDSDHSCWERAEDMKTPRTAYKIDPEHPGSDIAGETAAAMAAASIAFRPYNSSYSNLLLLHAKQLFSFADTFRGRYDDSIPVARQYYPSSSGYSDELLWAAAWLFEATDDQYYLKYIVENSEPMGGTGWAVREFSWDNKYAGLQVLLSKVLMEGGDETYSATLKQYKAKAEFFLCACLQKNNGYNVQMTPGGLLYVDEWNNLQYVSSAAFLLAVYSDYLSMSNAKLSCPEGQIPSSDLLKFAQSQVDYILGKNPKSMSYFVGYGPNYPTKVHHRGSSIEPKSMLPSPVGCVEGFHRWYDSKQSNPNVLIGALVGGPDKNDGFSDDRSNYEQTEPSLAGNAPLVGVFAKLKSMPYAPETAPKELRKPQSTFHGVPVRFIHSITNSWVSKGATHYRHKVIVKNISKKPITELRLSFENLTGELWGLSPSSEKNVYVLPSWLKVLHPGEEFSFVYIQGGPQAKVSLIGYH